MTADTGKATAGRTILIIDDEAAVRNVTRTLLERAGFRVLTAAGGAEGVALLAGEAGTVNLVVLDLNMPVMTGTQVLAELARVRPDIRVLLSSGYTQSEGMPSGPNVAGFLHKPFRFEELMRTIRAAMGEEPSS
jgi:two-component system, cell cycle sensor histidine kinase and response regulator CckA